MKKLMIILLVCLTIPSIANAATKVLQATWSYAVADEVDITGFEIINQDHVVVLPSIAKTARTVAFTATYTNYNPMSFYIRSVDATDPLNVEKSDPSNIKTFIPPRRTLKAPTNFGY